MDNEKRYCVYMHTNKLNGKKYIGQTVFQDDPTLRWGKNGEGYGANDLNNEGHLARSIRKYGWDNFEHEVLFKDLSKSDADFIEDSLILIFDTMNPQKGYNKRRGGSCGRASIETRQKQSIVRKGRIPWNKGIPMTDEAKKKLSEAHKKENLSAETRRKMSETQRLRGLGCKWLNDGTTSKFVKPDEVQHYLDLGWQIGRGTLLDQTGKLWVTNDKENVRICVDELEHYLNIGYK